MWVWLYQYKKEGGTITWIPTMYQILCVIQEKKKKHKTNAEWKVLWSHFKARSTSSWMLSDLLKVTQLGTEGAKIQRFSSSKAILFPNKFRLWRSCADRAQSSRAYNRYPLLVSPQHQPPILQIRAPRISCREPRLPISGHVACPGLTPVPCCR